MIFSAEKIGQIAEIAQSRITSAASHSNYLVRQAQISAKELLGESECRRLVRAEQYDELQRRIELLGARSGLLDCQIPRKGDLRIFYSYGFDEAGFGRAFVNLLYGGGDSESRLAGFLTYLKWSGLSVTWALPTYYLFITQPETEFFVEADTVNRFGRLAGAGLELNDTPHAERYRRVIELMSQLKTALAEAAGDDGYAPADMIDMHVVMVACAEEQARVEANDSAGVFDDSGEDRTLGSPFSPAAFELLEQLHESPNSQFYQSRQQEFLSYVQNPFEQLLLEVSSALRPEIAEAMELDNPVFGRIAKNGGRGSAWDFYWGAFNPKNHDRSDEAQLFVWMNHERVEFGFYIGDSSNEQGRRFVRNCQQNQQTLAHVFRESLTDDSMVFGVRDDFVGTPADATSGNRFSSWSAWLREPTQLDLYATVSLSSKEVLSLSPEALSRKIADTFDQVFPLVILAVSDDPIPEIRDYLGASKVVPVKAPEYTNTDLAREAGVDVELADGWVKTIDRKGQAILYGPSGVGKTYVAERLARHLVGGSDGFYQVLQFHPSYTYGQFVEEVRTLHMPGGEKKRSAIPGRFLEFAQKAASRQGRCVLVIDEIGRSDIPSVFGELLYLLENRDSEVTLASGMRLKVPANVRIIGTVSSTDGLRTFGDQTLRRRFAFIALAPNYELLRSKAAPGLSVDGLIQTIKSINDKVGDPNCEIGPSFFLRPRLAEEIKEIWQTELEPYLDLHASGKVGSREFSWEKVQNRILTA